MKLNYLYIISMIVVFTACDNGEQTRDADISSVEMENIKMIDTAAVANNTNDLMNEINQIAVAKNENQKENESGDFFEEEKSEENSPKSESDGNDKAVQKPKETRKIKYVYVKPQPKDTLPKEKPSPPKKISLGKHVKKTVIQDAQKTIYDAMINRNVLVNPSQRSQITIRLNEPITFTSKNQEHTLKRYSTITGYAALNMDRLVINFKTTILDGKIVDISFFRVYDTDKVLGLKVHIETRENKGRATRTGGRVAARLTDKILGTNDIVGSTVSEGEDYATTTINEKITIEKERPLYVEVSYGRDPNQE